MSEWDSYKTLLFRRRRIGTFRWRGWVMCILRIGWWELHVIHWTHKEEPEGMS